MLLHASYSDNPINNMAFVSASSSLSSEKLHPALVAAKTAIIKFQRKRNIVKMCVVNSYTFYQLAKQFYPNACLKAVVFVSAEKLVMHMIVALGGSHIIDPSAETDLVEGHYFDKYSELMEYHPHLRDKTMISKKEIVTELLEFKKIAQSLTPKLGYQFDGEVGKYQSDLENYLVEKGLIRIAKSK